MGSLCLYIISTRLIQLVLHFKTLSNTGSALGLRRPSVFFSFYIPFRCFAAVVTHFSGYNSDYVFCFLSPAFTPIKIYTYNMYFCLLLNHCEYTPILSIINLKISHRSAYGLEGCESIIGSSKVSFRH